MMYEEYISGTFVRATVSIICLVFFHEMAMAFSCSASIHTEDTLAYAAIDPTLFLASFNSADPTMGGIPYVFCNNSIYYLVTGLYSVT